MKPLRAFPFPLNIGTDICRISRIYTILQGPRARRFAERILAQEEHDQLRKFAPLGVASAQTGEEKLSSSLEERDPRGWKRAAFIAGR
jgi:holo-[acyl-carrier protein] synthase